MFSSDDEYEHCSSQKFMSLISVSPEYQIDIGAKSPEEDKEIPYQPHLIDVQNVCARSTHFEICLQSSPSMKTQPSNKIRCKDTNCTLSFKKERYMKEHYKRKHSAIKIICRFCGRQFNHRSGLYRHKENCTDKEQKSKEESRETKTNNLLK